MAAQISTIEMPTALAQPPATDGLASPNAPAVPAPAPGTAGTDPKVSPVFQETLNVNFIRDQRAKFTKQITQDKRIAKYVAWIVVLFIIALIAVVVVEYLLSIQSNKIDASIKDTKTRLSGLSSLEKDYLVYAQKIKLMYALDTARGAKQEATAFFYALVPPTDILKSVSTDNDQQKQVITFTAEAPDVFSILDLLKLFSAQDVADKGYSIQSQNLSRGADGTYTIDGTLDYSKAADMKKNGSEG